MAFSKRFQKLFQELVALIGEDHIREVEVERRIFGGYRIRIARGGGEPQIVVPSQPASESQPEAIPAPVEPAAVGPDEVDGLHTVPSLMVGMFYRASSPDLPPFVEEGDIVAAGQTLCIIEAMKIMNEIEADIKGRVVRVLVDNGQPVEYNTPLFLLEPL